MDTGFIFFATLMLIGVLIVAHYCKKALDKTDYDKQYNDALKHAQQQYLNKLKDEK